MREDDVVRTIQCSPLSSSLQIYQFTKFVFDNSVLEVEFHHLKKMNEYYQIWLALASGSTLFIDDSPFTHHRFISNINHYGITHALLFPGLVAAFS